MFQVHRLIEDRVAEFRNDAVLAAKAFLDFLLRAEIDNGDQAVIDERRQAQKRRDRDEHRERFVIADQESRLVIARLVRDTRDVLEQLHRRGRAQQVEDGLADYLLRFALQHLREARVGIDELSLRVDHPRAAGERAQKRKGMLQIAVVGHASLPFTRS